MVQPVPTKEGPPSAKKIAPPAKKPVPFSIMIMRLGGGRPFTLVDEKPGYWLIHFLGDSEPTKILK